MKRLFTTAAMAALLLLVSFTKADAKIRRVGYPGPKTNLDYSNLQSAVNDCSTNPNKPDTIYVFPGSWVATYDKKIITIGFGYYVDTTTLGTGANTSLQNIFGAMDITIQLSNNTTGCTFEGLDGLIIQGYYNDTDGITVKRCNCNIDFRNVIHSNWKILQCNVSLTASFSAFIVNILVSNCIVQNFATTLLTSQTGMLLNNVFTTNWTDPSFIFKNNIFLYEGNFSVLSTSTYDYNVFVGNPSGLHGSHNKINQNPDGLFVGYSNQKTYSNDGRWQLKSNSPAKGFGENGIDCGIYDGNYPYHLSGIPPVPAFYRLDASSGTTGTTSDYKITFSVRSNN